MKYRLNKHQKRLPLGGGHHFPEKGAMIKGESFNEVVELLASFRLFNGKPLGNPVQEVTDYYADKYPWMVELDTEPVEEEELEEEYVAWRDWISSVWGKPMGRFLSKRESSDRLQICKNCPHNVGKPWYEGEEAVEFNRKSLMLKRGNLVDEKLGYCDLHKCDIGVSSFIENPIPVSRKPKDEQDYPACWFTNLGS